MPHVLRKASWDFGGLLYGLVLTSSSQAGHPVKCRSNPYNHEQHSEIQETCCPFLCQSSMPTVEERLHISDEFELKFLFPKAVWVLEAF